MSLTPATSFPFSFTTTVSPLWVTSKVSGAAGALVGKGQTSWKFTGWGSEKFSHTPAIRARENAFHGGRLAIRMKNIGQIHYPYTLKR
jgi:hypothetical protein